jgi:hypothetical protein
MKMLKSARIGFLMFLVATVVCVSPALAEELKITTLSSRPEMVSGGDTLVKIEAPDSIVLEKIRVSRNGSDVTGVFNRGSGHFLVGLVGGLKEGGNKIEAKAGAAKASLAVNDYSIKGPIFSGPHDDPYVCETVKSGLGEPLDTDCTIETRVQYYYMSTSGKISKLSEVKKYPADVTTTTTSAGKKVPYVVRVETGTIDRGIYQITMLDDPARAKSDAYERNDSWNGRLLMNYGGGSGIGHHQGSLMGGFSSGGAGGGGGDAVDNSIIAKGYAVATSTLMTYGTSGSDTLAAEATMMLKEHFIKRYGVPVYTAGWGGSGGGMLQHLISQNYPGILEAIFPVSAFPCGQDLAWVHMEPVLLLHYFDGFPGGPVPEIFPASAATKNIEWAEDQEVAVSGYNIKAQGLSWTGGNSEQYRSGGTNPLTAAWPGSMSGIYQAIPEDVYDPISNPTGIRATAFDAQKAMFGTGPKTGFAYWAWSNTGEQYGLLALNAGKISVAQFLDLNENIGGFDKDGYFQKERTRADDQGLINSYRTGRKFMGYHVNLPVVDLRPYNDMNPRGETHLRYHSFQTKIRLMHANGTDANRVMWTYTYGLQFKKDAAAALNAASPGEVALAYMDEWMLNILGDNSSDSYAQKVIKNKSAKLMDGYWAENGKFVSDPASLDPNTPTNKLYPFGGDTIIAAGSPIEEEATACTLKAAQKSEYKVTFTDEEWARLNKIFKDGVCDYTKPGIHQDIKSTPWLSYGPAPQIDYKQE